MVKKIGLILGPLSFIFLNFLILENIDEKASIVIALAAWMIIWWISEAVSISVTSLLPLVIFPLFQVMEINQVGANYGSSIVFLFFGGFVLALALEKVNLHKRIALTIINKTGTSPNRVILGFMIATAFMSMWISNTASTVVMLPIALSVINLLIDNQLLPYFEKNAVWALRKNVFFSKHIYQQSPTKNLLSYKIIFLC